MCCLENVCQYWQQWFGSSFSSGLVLAAVMLACILLIYFILRIIIWSITRHKRVNRVVISGKDGDIVISESAILDTVRSVVPEFPEIEAGKIRLSRKRQDYFMELHICYHPGGKSLNECCDALRESIKAALAERLHITQLTRIDIRLDRLTAES